MSLSEQFEKAKAIFCKVEDGEEVNIGESIATVTAVIEAVEKGSLFSRNEELDDISTTNLKVGYDAIILLSPHDNDYIENLVLFFV